MKKLNLFDKGIYVINSIFACLLLVSYALPYVFPRSFPSVSVLSLLVPVLLIINAMFSLFWLIRLKKQVFMSVVVLLIGYNHLTNFYKFPRKQEALMESSLLSVMTYNVRLFNVYDWNPDKQLDDKMIALLRIKVQIFLQLQ